MNFVDGLLKKIGMVFESPMWNMFNHVAYNKERNVIFWLVKET